MKYCIYDEVGKILRTGHAPQAAWPAMVQLEPRTLFDIPEDADDVSHYVNVNTFQVLAKPAKPNNFHAWSYEHQQWEPLLDEARAYVAAAIEKVRVKGILAPIEFNGILLDADIVAQDNIKTKLAEIKASIELEIPIPAELLVWRDHNNVSHVFESTEAYYRWLSGLTLAMSQRGTRCYMWMWQKKEELSKCTTVEEILALDLTM